MELPSVQISQKNAKPNRAILLFRGIPDFESSRSSIVIEATNQQLWRNKWFSGGGFACISVAEKREERDFAPTMEQLLRRPLALAAAVPRDAALFLAGAVAGAAAKTVTAPLDRIKLLMQTHGLRARQEGAKKAIGFIEAFTLIGKQEGLKGYWKGNLPQVTYPLDVLRLRLAVEPGYKTMSEVALNMLREEGVASFYNGLGPSLIGIAPYIAVNFCIFDLLKQSVPKKYQNRTETSLAMALVSATLSTLMCYPLDTMRRQMQMKGTPYKTVLDAFPGIVARDGLIGLYRGFVPNALKNLPNSSIRLTTFDTVKHLIAAGEEEFQRIVEENRKKQNESTSNPTD
ncbi:thylakoid ADP,ATP carrier protein, chloroplastic-like isoform X2 [Actinidia eriantha]|uniref:thylakoid ADP,ATP carrier protein, chloroplastic-like isoform X2 n=1 Tax=Actinidia eriantha TaxID=165200 RepID=UPI002585638A|nr:thylakoid ADP,ATP carrier protein, chloroplastic-like isoform X2 [Actinidia eriantha]